MPRTQAERTKRTLIQAAAGIVHSQGVGSLTLEEVAREAGVSKGGLLYHFPNKEALVGAMMDFLLEMFEAEIEAAKDADDTEPGSWLRAFVRATFYLDDEQRELNAALLAAAADYPDVLDAAREAFGRWQERAIDDGVDPARATVIRLAADGVWFADVFNIAPPAGPFRDQTLELLLEMTREPGAS